MFDPPAPTKPRGGVCSFSSGTGLSELSNFAFLEEPIQYKGMEWNTAEHAYMAQRVAKEDRHRLAAGGDLADLSDSSVALVYGISDQNAIAKKRKYWSAKGKRPAMPGIIAKMATKPVTAKRLGLKLKKWCEEKVAEQDLIDAFVPILVAKYRTNPASRKILLDTGKATLVEFSRSAIRDPQGSRWTGLVDKDNGFLHGGNLQGRIHMIVRHMLRGEVTA